MLFWPGELFPYVSACEETCHTVCPTARNVLVAQFQTLPNSSIETIRYRRAALAVYQPKKLVSPNVSASFVLAIQAATAITAALIPSMRSLLAFLSGFT